MPYSQTLFQTILDQLIWDEDKFGIEPTREHIAEVLDNYNVKPEEGRCELEDTLFWRLK
jgi:hypothetical protein